MITTEYPTRKQTTRIYYIIWSRDDELRLQAQEEKGNPHLISVGMININNTI